MESTGEGARLRIQLLGEFAVWVGAERVADEQWRSRRASSLVKLLALAPGCRLHRDQVIDRLWPESGLAAAANSFYQTLFIARRALAAAGPDCLRLEDGLLSLSGGADLAVWVDVDAFEAAAAAAKDSLDAGRYQATLALYPGDLLPEDRYAEWTLQRREVLRRQYLALLLGLARQLEARQEYPRAIETLQRLLQEDRANEEAHACLMRVYVLSGQRQQALRQYQALCEALRAELDIAPGENTARLFAEIQSGAFAAEDVSVPLSALTPTRRHNLPAELTSFIGREAEISAVARLARERRLVTIIGAGGVGKTRLALRVGAALLDEFPHGVWLAELAPLSDPAQVANQVAEVLQVQPQPGQSLPQALATWLRSRSFLIILDNCEHVLDGVVPLVLQLLRDCPHLHILATSRAVLEVEGETHFYCPSLSLPDGQPAMADLGQSEAVRLFCERAGSARPGFKLSETNGATVAQICRRLDGIPLAIELAAARTQMMQIEEIESRLDDYFHLLTGGSRETLPRHKTLRACIDWSYYLLSPPEQHLLQLMAVFGGGWVMDASEFALRGANAGELSVYDLLAQLVNKSLVTADFVAGQPTRYHMLETIRQYAYEKLAATGQAAFTRDLHLQYYLRLSGQLEGELRGPNLVQALDILESELDNIRMALAWSLERREAAGPALEAGLRIAAALLYFWHSSYRHLEGLEWLERLLMREEEERGEQPATLEWANCRAKALYVAAWVAKYSILMQKSLQYAEEGARLYCSLGLAGRLGQAYVNTVLGYHQHLSGNWDKGMNLLKESLAIFEQEGDHFGCSEALLILGDLAWRNLDYEKARQYFDRHMKIKQELGDLDGIAGGYFYQGILALDMGQDGLARTDLEKSLGLFTQIHNLFIENVIYFLVILEKMEGNDARAVEYAQELLAIGQRRGNPLTVSYGLACLGILAMAQGQFDEAEHRLEGSLSIALKIHSAEEWFFRWQMAKLAWAKDDLARAEELFTQVLALGRENAEKHYQACALFGLGRVAYAQERYDQARKYLLDALNTFADFTILLWDIAYAPETLAYVEIAQNNPARAARLLGATQARCERFKRMRTPKERAMREKAIESASAALGEEAFATAWQAGLAMTPDQVVRYALDALNEPA